MPSAPTSCSTRFRTAARASPCRRRSSATEDRRCAVGGRSSGADVRRPLVIIVAAALLLVGAAPAAPPDPPVSYIGVGELKLRLARGDTAALICGRTWQAERER